MRTTPPRVAPLLALAAAPLLAACGTLGPPNPYALVTTAKVAQLIGDRDEHLRRPTLNLTARRYGIAGTDMGSPVRHQGRLWFLFGDTHPAPGIPFDKRHDDSIAHTTSTQPAELRLTFVTAPDAPDRWLPPRIACPDRGLDDCFDLGGFNVPLTGVSDGDTLFVWFSVGFSTDLSRNAPRSILARTGDGARTFRHVYDFGRTHFINVHAVRARGPIPGLPASAREPFVLIFGSGTVQHPHVYAAAAPLESLRRGDRGAVRFLAEVRFEGEAARLRWSTREADAVPIFQIELESSFHAMVVRLASGFAFGEPLVDWNPRAGRWLATYNTGVKRIRLRAADHWYGPWSQSIVLFDPEVDYGRGRAFGRFIAGGDPDLPPEKWGSVYAPFVLPQMTEGPDEKGRITLYHLLSTGQPYTVVVMRAVLAPRVTLEQKAGLEKAP